MSLNTIFYSVLAFCFALSIALLLVHAYAGKLDRKRRGDNPTEPAQLPELKYNITLYALPSLEVITVYTIHAANVSAAMVKADKLANDLGYHWRDLTQIK